MNLNEKILIAFGEMTGQVIAILILYNMTLSIFKYFALKTLKYFGIEYFAEIIEAYKWAGQAVIEARAILNADRAVYYRCSNGKFFLENNSKQNENIKVKAIINRTRDKGVVPLPDDLRADFDEWFQKMQTSDELIENFVPDLKYEDALRGELKKIGILGYVALKIRRENELYGILVFTWSDVNTMPKNLMKKHYDFINTARATLLSQTLFIIERTLKFKLRKLLRMEV